MYRIGIDVGGTFTDFTLLNDETCGISYFKVSSTPKDPSEAIRQGIAQMLSHYRIDARDVAFVGHGTTVATNMIIERRGVSSGLLTTKGFRDVLEIGRQMRPNLYDYNDRKPDALVPREHRFEITERIGADGDVITAIDTEELRAAVESLKDAGVKAVAICFLHAYRNPAHEKIARDMVERLMPDVYVSVSSEVLPEFREYERLSTTVLNAYSGPKMQAYLDRLSSSVAEMGMRQEPYTIHSNGGLMSIPTVRKFPVRTCLSGPAAGVVGSAVVGRAAGFPNLITFDVGGTSTDVSMIKDGKPVFTSNRLVADYPIKMPMVDIHVIGAGGGSIAWIDEGGALRVGPHSAGAVPGPVAFGRGGSKPTVTDAHVALKRIGAERMSGGVALDVVAARASIHALAATLKETDDRIARAIIATADATMARALRRVSVERGVDPRSCVLIAFGGGGPLHACGLADMLGVTRVVVPPHAGVLSALGLAMTPERRESMASVMQQLDVWRDKDRAAIADALVEQAWPKSQLPKPKSRTFFARMRYRGQGHELDVPFEAKTSQDVLASSFAKLHDARYGFTLTQPVEVVSVRFVAEGAGRQPRLEREAKPIARQLTGPASLALPDATLFVAKGWKAKLFDGGAWRLDRT